MNSDNTENKNNIYEQEFTRYTDRMLEIRMLSSPDIKTLDSAESYSERLKNNFRRIGELASENREMLKNVLYPQLESDEYPDDELGMELYDFADRLVTVAGELDDYENLDLPMAALVSDKLISKAENSGNITELIRQMDEHIAIYYSLINVNSRVHSQPQLYKAFFDKGIEIGRRFLDMLDKDVFLTIPDVESRGCVLTNARFMTALYESFSDTETKRVTLEILDRMLEIADDPFYIEAVPGFNWDYFRFRVYEYFVQSTEVFNQRKFDADQLAHICDRADEMVDLCEINPDYYKTINGYGFYPIHVMRCRCLAGRMSLKEYRQNLIDIYATRDKEDLTIDGAYYNIVIPLELLSMMDPEEYSAEEVRFLEEVYMNISAYLFRFPSGGILSFVMDYVTALMERFVEVASGMTFEAFVVKCMASIHPPTYIHSRMVGQISERLTYHLIRKSPELFAGMENCETVDEVIRHRNRIVDFAYHAGLCHDFGKICIIDTIFVYGRHLLDSEFNVIKTHPLIGEELLRKHTSTNRFVDVALGHHKWYNDEGGYPQNLRTSDSPVKIMIDIVACADCMDAATDTVGRSYNRGKTLDEFMKELKEGSGTRYNPCLYELLQDPVVHKDIEYLLTEGRQSNYRETYNLLKDVKDRG